MKMATNNQLSTVTRNNHRNDQAKLIFLLVLVALATLSPIACAIVS
ncbi:hypothetical protein ACFL1U_03280 [Patescibacteria group bacterium]